MTGRVKDKVAFITGAARGQGRSHAIRLAEEGADIIAIDICAPVATAPHTFGTAEDLAETVAAVEATGRRIVATQADVRDYDQLKTALDDGVNKLGRLDIVSANAGIGSVGYAHELEEQVWQDVIDINLSGVWHTAKAAIPHLIDGQRGGSIVITSSIAGLKGVPNCANYVAAKHGIVGLMRSLAAELAPHRIRVNTLHPTNVNTKLLHNDAFYGLFRPDLEQPTLDDAREVMLSMNALPVPWVEPIDVSNALLFLASEEARYITGVTLPVDAGCLTK